MPAENEHLPTEAAPAVAQIGYGHADVVRVWLTTDGMVAVDVEGRASFTLDPADALAFSDALGELCGWRKFSVQRPDWEVPSAPPW